MKLKFLSLIGLFVVFACSTPKQTLTKTESSAMLENGKYRVVNVGDSDYSKEDLSLNIDLDKNQISGYNGCNSFSASLHQNGNQLTIGDAISTLRHCEDKVVMERDFMKGLGNIDSYSFENGQLVLKSSDGKILMRADKIENKLVSGNYKVISLRGESVQKEGLNLHIDADANRISGNAGCNTFGSEYNTEDNQIVLGLSRVTRMYCEDKMDLERSFLQGLGEIDVFDFDGSTLEFRSADGKSIIVAKKVENNLIGGDYEVINLEGKSLEGQNVTLHVEAEVNRLSGNAGCNGFGTEYTIDGNNIELGHALITKMYCEGKMDLERAFMKSLGKVQSFSYNGEVLELKSADGTSLITAKLNK